MGLYLRGRFDLCTGCNICLLVCSARATGGYNPRWARLKVTMEKENLLNRPLVCSQCTNAYCERSCPTKAIYRSSDTGAVLVKKEDCTGCGLCAEACPEGMMFFDGGGKADKCDLCHGNPKCVQYCAQGALETVEL